MSSKKGIIVSVIAIVIIIGAFVCYCISEAGQRAFKSIGSNVSGLPRIINIYDYEGDLIATYKGTIDIEENDTKVLFDLDGKRYIYYNCLVEVIEIPKEDVES